MEGLKKFYLTAFDVISIVGQHIIILVTKKTSLDEYPQISFRFFLAFPPLFSSFI